ncbi:MAG: hypothetical protein BWY70_00978 [Bacteroidetes bacterium ADurb.Bin408]|nr:MAG: hypothetical protein BWY70_00978 [Bacteroidetes bacterium ADurb.Bin408]
MKNLKIYILLFLVFVLTNNNFSQERSFSITAGYGLNKPVSDLQSQGSGSGGMGFYFNPVNALDVGITFNMGTFNGKQNNYVYDTVTGVKFLNNFFDYGIKAIYNLYSLIDPNPYAKFALSISAGIGLMDFRSRIEDLNGNYLHGFGYENAQTAKKKPTTELLAPFSLGFKYRFNKNYSLALEPTFIWCNTDKLDDVINGKKDFYFYFPLIFEYKLYVKPLK